MSGRHVIAGICLALSITAGVRAAAGSPYGVNAHIPSRELLDATAGSGISWIRIDLNWSLVEPTQGRFDWSEIDRVVDDAEKHSLRIFATLAYTPAWATTGTPGTGVPDDPEDWYDFCFRTAQRYRGRIEHFGMWNEPNLPKFFSGSRAEYIAVILKVGSRAVRAANPDARVCGPELAHLESASWELWLEDVLEHAGDDLDVVTHHIYPSGSDPGSVVDALARDQRYPWEPRSVREILYEQGWLPRPFWLTETGYDSRSPNLIGEAAQARFVAGLLAGLFGPDREVTWVQKVFFYEASDDPRFVATWGLLGPPPAYEPKPAFDSYRAFAAANEVDDASVVAAVLPEVLRPDERVRVRMTFHNTGTTTWSAASGYHLGATGERDVFAAERHELDPGEEVPPGGVVTFEVDFRAPVGVPAQGATYDTGWQLARDGYREFGELVRGRVAVTTVDTVREVLFLPAVANTPGLNQTHWRSDLAVLSTGPEPAELAVTAWLPGQDGSSGPTKMLTVAPGTQRRLENVLEELFHLSGSAALRLQLLRGHLGLAARTYTGAGGGTVSQRVPVLPAAAATRAGATAHLVGLAHSADRRTGYRTNLGLLNLAAHATTARVELLGDAGVPVGTFVKELAPQSFVQITDVYRKLAAPDVASGAALVRPQGGPVLTWASVVDNASSDSNLITPAVPADEPVVVVAAAHADGLQGSSWRTDVTLANLGLASSSYAVELLTPAAMPPPPATSTRLDAMVTALVPDVVASLFGLEGAGALRVTPSPGGTAAAFGVTSTTSPVGRVGQSAPAARSSDALAFGPPAYLPGLAASRSSSEGFRTNLGLVNVSEAAADVEIALFTSSGTAIGTLSVALEPHTWWQLTNVFRYFAHDVESGFAAVRTTTPPGRVLAWASVVDNASNDSILVPGW